LLSLSLSLNWWFSIADTDFERGLSAAFARWTAVQIAIQEQFAGRDTEAVVRQLMIRCAQLATMERAPDVDALASEMYDAFDHMHCDLEDNSPEEMAAVIVRLREECLRGEFSFVHTLESRAAADSRAVMSLCVRDPRFDNDDDDDDEQNTDDIQNQNSTTPNENADGGASDEASQALQASGEAMVEDDGFTVVAPRRGTRRS